MVKKRTTPREKSIIDAIPKICSALHSGVTRQQAALIAGVKASTFASWLLKAEASDEDAMQLVDAMERAEAQAAMGLLKLIKSAAEEEDNKSRWRAAAHILDKRYQFEALNKPKATSALFTAAEVVAMIREIGDIVRDTVNDVEARNTVVQRMAKLTLKISERKGAA